MSDAPDPPDPPAAAGAVGLSKVYGSGDLAVRAVDDVSVAFESGRFTAVMGPSGSGKSTFIFQSFNLIPTLTAQENITLSADLAGHGDREWLKDLVERLRIADRMSFRPSKLSGGQQQRVACARALIGRPDLIFADEPTGNLDSNASAEVLGFLRSAVDEHAQSIVMVTHEPAAAAYADRVVFLADGWLVGELQSPTAASVLEQMKRLGG